MGANGDIENEVFIGPNACLSDHIKMEKNSVLGIGGTLLQDAESGGVYVGCPANLKRKNTGIIFK